MVDTWSRDPVLPSDWLLQGTAPVRYSAAGWRHLAYSMGRTNLAAEILSKSDK